MQNKEEDFALDSVSDSSGGGRTHSRLKKTKRQRRRLSIDEHNSTQQSAQKRPAAINDVGLSRPLKRQKGTLNNGYLEILNKDIEDAALRVCLEGEPVLPSSQAGIIRWSTTEKKQMYEAISRLGKFNLNGIAARIGTKSSLEVRQYIDFMDNTMKRRRAENSRSILEFAELPAAVELSSQCCIAQEYAADAISFRQEKREQQREGAKWGQYWDITQQIATKLDSRFDTRMIPAPPDLPEFPFAELFHVPEWLELSERVFMNSSIDESNWINLDTRPPSIWTTAFEDFHSLAVTLTRRIVQTAIFIAMSRIKAKVDNHPELSRAVRRRDVRAAVASLDLSRNSANAWATCARRLRINVLNDKEGDDQDNPLDPMTYDAVETALSQREHDPKSEKSDTLRQGHIVPPLNFEDSSDSNDHDDNDDNDNADDDDDMDQNSTETNQELYEVETEVHEALLYSAASVRDVPSWRTSVRRLVRAERKHEREADIRDEYASRIAEDAIWAAMDQESPLKNKEKLQEPSRIQRSNLSISNIYPVGERWSEKLEYYAPWETMTTPKDRIADKDTVEAVSADGNSDNDTENGSLLGSGVENTDGTEQTDTEQSDNGNDNDNDGNEGYDDMEFV